MRVVKENTLTFVKEIVMIILTNVEVRRMSGEKRLPDTELEVMTAIWKCEIPVKTSEIARHIERDWTMSTIQRFIFTVRHSLRT